MNHDTILPYNERPVYHAACKDEYRPKSVELTAAGDVRILFVKLASGVGSVLYRYRSCTTSISERHIQDIL